MVLRQPRGKLGARSSGHVACPEHCIRANLRNVGPEFAVDLRLARTNVFQHPSKTSPATVALNRFALGQALRIPLGALAEPVGVDSVGIGREPSRVAPECERARGSLKKPVQLRRLNPRRGVMVQPDRL